VSYARGLPSEEGFASLVGKVLPGVNSVLGGGKLAKRDKINQTINASA
jgi:hypothetical protein